MSQYLKVKEYPRMDIESVSSNAIYPEKRSSVFCRIVMRELAKFHAVGHAYVMQKAKESSIEQVAFLLKFFLLLLLYLLTKTWSIYVLLNNT